MKMNCSVCGLICLMVGFMWVFRPRSSVKGFAPPPESNLDHCERHMPKVPAAHKAGRPWALPGGQHVLSGQVQCCTWLRLCSAAGGCARNRASLKLVLPAKIAAAKSHGNQCQYRVGDYTHIWESFLPGYGTITAQLQASQMSQISSKTC